MSWSSHVNLSKASQFSTGISAKKCCLGCCYSWVKTPSGSQAAWFLPVCFQRFNPWMPMKVAYPGADLKVSISIARTRIQDRENRCTKCLLLLWLHEGEWRFPCKNDVTGTSLLQGSTDRFLWHTPQWRLCRCAVLNKRDWFHNVTQILVLVLISVHVFWMDKRSWCLICNQKAKEKKTFEVERIAEDKEVQHLCL